MTRHTVGPAGTGPRSQVTTLEPAYHWQGTSRRWTRTIDGQTYAFTLVTMPDGEVRWWVNRYNGYSGGPRFACAWSPHRAWRWTTLEEAISRYQMLKHIQDADPDGGDREPTDADHARHRHWAIATYGMTVWNAYRAGGWQLPAHI